MNKVMVEVVEGNGREDEARARKEKNCEMKNGKRKLCTIICHFSYWFNSMKAYSLAANALLYQQKDFFLFAFHLKSYNGQVF